MEIGHVHPGAQQFRTRRPLDRGRRTRRAVSGSHRCRRAHRTAEVVKQVAAELRNTPAVCRKSYINPAVFDSWRSGSIHENIDGKLTAASARKAETLVLAFLRQEGNAGGAARRQPVLQRVSTLDDRPA
jgi:DNA topoisomerase IB